MTKVGAIEVAAIYMLGMRAVATSITLEKPL
jgi:hypothetical protein